MLKHRCGPWLSYGDLKGGLEMVQVKTFRWHFLFIVIQWDEEAVKGQETRFMESVHSVRGQSADDISLDMSQQSCDTV